LPVSPTKTGVAKLSNHKIMNKPFSTIIIAGTIFFVLLAIISANFFEKGPMIEVGYDGEKIEDIRNLDVPDWVKFFKQLGSDGVLGVLIFFVFVAMWVWVSEDDWNARLDKDRKNVRKEQLITVSSILLIVLFFSAGGLPYSFYVIGKFVVFATCTWIAIETFKQNYFKWLVVFAVVAIVYNPILPLELDRSVWHQVNLATVVFLIFAYNKLQLKSAGEGLPQSKN
jgi:hypothetical protein